MCWRLPKGRDRGLRLRKHPLPSHYCAAEASSKEKLRWDTNEGRKLQHLDALPSRYPPARQKGLRGFVKNDTRNIPGVSQPPQDAWHHQVCLHPQHGLTMGSRFGLTSCQVCHMAGYCLYKDRTFIKTVINGAVWVSESCIEQLGLIWHHRSEFPVVNSQEVEFNCVLFNTRSQITFSLL